MNTQTITDEQIAEMEQEALRKYREPLEWFVYEPSYVLALISRLRAAERDAARYRWLRDGAPATTGTVTMVSMANEYGDRVSDWIHGNRLDAKIDAAMAQPEPNRPA